MVRSDLLSAAKHLSVEERLAFIDELIESVQSETLDALPSELEAELDRRYQASQRNPDEGEPWEVVRERIQESLNTSRDPRVIGRTIRGR